MVQRPVMENWQLIKKESDPHVLTWKQRQRRRFQCAECAATGIKRGARKGDMRGSHFQSKARNVPGWHNSVLSTHRVSTTQRPMGSPQRCLWCREDRSGLSARIPPGSSTGFALTSFIHLAWVPFVGFQKCTHFYYYYYLLLLLIIIVIEISAGKMVAGNKWKYLCHLI